MRRTLRRSRPPTPRISQAEASFLSWFLLVELTGERSSPTTLIVVGATASRKWFGPPFVAPVVQQTMRTGALDDNARRMTLRYKGGAQTVVVPANAPVVTFEPGTRDMPSRVVMHRLTSAPRSCAADARHASRAMRRIRARARPSG